MAKQIIVDELLVNYLDENQTAATTAVFLHGWQSSAEVWSLVIASLAGKDLRMVALDLPGFGKSQLPKKAFDVGEYANFVKSFLEKIGVNYPIIVGHSFGGRVGIKLAALHPEVVSKLVLVDSAGFADKSVSTTTKQTVAKILKPIFSLPGLRGLKKKTAEMAGATDYSNAGALRETFVKTVREDLSEFLPMIKSPTLLLWGADDTDTPVAFGEKMESLIPGSRLIVFPNAGHFSFLDAKNAFVRELENFIA